MLYSYNAKLFLYISEEKPHFVSQGRVFDWYDDLRSVAHLCQFICNIAYIRNQSLGIAKLVNFIQNILNKLLPYLAACQV